MTFVLLLFIPRIARIAMTKRGSSSPYFQTISPGLGEQRGWVCLVQGRAELLLARSSAVREAG